jgi:hypothetical protein
LDPRACRRGLCVALQKGVHMINKELVKQLAAVQSAQGIFLSASLSTSRLDDWRQTAPTFLNSEFHRLSRFRPYTKEEQRTLQDDLHRVLEVLQYEVNPPAQGLLVYADGSGGFFQSVELPLRLTNRLLIEPSPYIRPLVHALCVLAPFVVVRVSRDDSTIYLVDQWRLSREEDLTGPYLKSSDRATGDVPVKEYYAAARQETLVEQHFKEVSGALEKLLAETGVRQLVLCGQHDIVSNYRKFLGPLGSGCAWGEIAWDAVASVNQLLAAARAEVQAVRARETEALVARISEGLGPQGMGVSGFEDTMDALRRGQVQTLVVDRNARPPGWRCLQCDFVSITDVVVCPVCDGRVVPLDDVLGEAVRVAVLHNALVEVAEGVPALEAMGQIAGIMRFR